MKLPTAPTRSPATTKDTQKKGSFEASHAIELARESVETLKAFSEYKKEVEVTTRAKIEGQKAIVLSEHELEKARLAHCARIAELDNQDRNSERSHEQVMTSLAQADRKLGLVGDKQESILKQLEAKEITPSEAALLLSISQE